MTSKYAYIKFTQKRSTRYIDNIIVIRNRKEENKIQWSNSQKEEGETIS